MGAALACANPKSHRDAQTRIVATGVTHRRNTHQAIKKSISTLSTTKNSVAPSRQATPKRSTDDFRWRGGGQARGSFLCGRYGLYSKGRGGGVAVALDQDRRKHP
jgi:hypothetical protein